MLTPSPPPGSSLLSKLTHMLAIHALKLSGLISVTSCVILPMATGFSISTCLLSIAESRPGAKKVSLDRPAGRGPDIQSACTRLLA